jgi:hypothetical protein
VRYCSNEASQIVTHKSREWWVPEARGRGKRRVAALTGLKFQLCNMNQFQGSYTVQYCAFS